MTAGRNKHEGRTHAAKDAACPASARTGYPLRL
jgi:hypothetical protein